MTTVTNTDNRTDTTSNLLTETEVAKILNVSPETLQRWRSTRLTNLTYIKVGRLVRYRIEDINAFITANANINNNVSGGGDA